MAEVFTSLLLYCSRCEGFSLLLNLHLLSPLMSFGLLLNLHLLSPLISSVLLLNLHLLSPLLSFGLLLNLLLLGPLLSFKHSLSLLLRLKNLFTLLLRFVCDSLYLLLPIQRSSLSVLFRNAISPRSLSSTSLCLSHLRLMLGNLAATHI